MNIDTIVYPDYLGKTFRELADAPISALKGVTPAAALALQQAFGVNSRKVLPR